MNDAAPTLNAGIRMCQAITQANCTRERRTGSRSICTTYCFAIRQTCIPNPQTTRVRLSIAALFGRDVRLRFGEIRRSLFQESRERFLGFSGAHPLTELALLNFDGRFDLLDETLFEKPLAG